ncbi:TadE family protein [Streptomyces sp. NPDC001904]|uniref:TadE/TadG family type IV pilus assembly protein n=1 Tax=Streptomyces sp. NPDC001904 TaxID=3154531 RepID=UPI0033184097
MAATMRSRLPARLADDRGSSPIAMAIVFPVVLLVTIAAVQGFLYAYARNVAYTAAREGVSGGRMYQATPGQGAATARAALSELSGDVLVDARVSTAGSSAEQIQIQVTGRAISLVPGLGGWSVSASASGPVERWTTAQGGAR